MSEISYVDALISSTDEYFRYKSDSNSQTLLRHLQDMCQPNRVSFDVNNDVERLYVCLHQLITRLQPSSSVFWAALNVLLKCCNNLTQNPVPVNNLIAPVTELLLLDLAFEKKLCVLKIVLELTKGMKIVEKEPYLPILASKLVEFIMSEELEIIRISLLILVDLCQNSVFLEHCLKDCIGGSFFRAVINLQDVSISTKLQMCKLLFLLEPISLSVDGPPDVSCIIIDITFSNLFEANEKKEFALIAEIVKFLKELTLLPMYVELFRSHERCQDYAQRLLGLLASCDGASVCAVVELVLALLHVNMPALRQAYPSMVERSLRWLEEEEDTRPEVLQLLASILQGVGSPVADDRSAAVICSLDQHLHIFFQLYRTEMRGNEGTLVALLKVLKEMLKFTELRSKLTRVINVRGCEEIFGVLHSYYEDAQHSTDSVLLCVGVLDFLSCLAQYDAAYLPVRDALGASPDMQRVLCSGLYLDEARSDVLRLMNRNSLPGKCLDNMAKILSGSAPDEVFSNNTGGPKPSKSFMNLSSFGASKGGELEETISTAMEKLERNELSSIPMSTVMSLLELKVSAASSREQNLKSNLESAQNFCKEIEQKMAAMDLRNKQMRQLHLRNVQCAETLNAEINALHHLRDFNQSNNSKSMRKYKEELFRKENLIRKKRMDNKELNQTVKRLHQEKIQKERNLAAVGEQTAAATDSAHALSSRLCSLQMEFERGQAAYKGFVERHQALDEQLTRNTKTLTQQEEEIARLERLKAAVEQDVNNLRMVSAAQVKTLQEKDPEIQKLQKQLSDLKRVRDLIANISGGQAMKKD